MANASRARKAVNVAVPAGLLEAARAEGINLSATLEAALKERLEQKQREAWLAANREGIDAYNRDVEERGVFSDGLRAF